MTDSSIPKKRCAKCKRNLPATFEFFAHHSRGKYGLQPRCKKCQAEDRAMHAEENAEYQRRYQAEHKEDLAEKHRKYRAEHRAEKAARDRKYQAEHPEIRAAIQRRYHTKHAEAIRERQRAARAEHPEKRSAIQRRYAIKHAEKIRRYQEEHKEARAEYRRQYAAEHRKEKAEYDHKYRTKYAKEKRENDRRYRIEHPEVKRAGHLRRKARKRNLPDSFTAEQAKSALVYWNWTCVYCGKSLAQLSLFDDIRLHFDHFIPLADKRKDNPGTVAENMIPACSGCNIGKSDCDPIEWIAWKFGPRKAKKIIAAITEYFKAVTA